MSTIVARKQIVLISVQYQYSALGRVRPWGLDPWVIAKYLAMVRPELLWTL